MNIVISHPCWLEVRLNSLRSRMQMHWRDVDVWFLHGNVADVAWPYIATVCFWASCSPKTMYIYICQFQGHQGRRIPGGRTIQQQTSQIQSYGTALNSLLRHSAVSTLPPHIDFAWADLWPFLAGNGGLIMPRLRWTPCFLLVAGNFTALLAEERRLVHLGPLPSLFRYLHGLFILTYFESQRCFNYLIWFAMIICKSFGGWIHRRSFPIGWLLNRGAFSQW